MRCGVDKGVEHYVVEQVGVRLPLKGNRPRRRLWFTRAQNVLGWSSGCIIFVLTNAEAIVGSSLVLLRSTIY